MAKALLTITFLTLITSSCSVFKTHPRRDSSDVIVGGRYVVESQNNYINLVDTAMSKIEGYVLDARTNVLEGYGGVRLNNDHQIGTWVDSSGYFSLLVMPGTYQVNFYHAGHNALTIDSISVKQNSKVSLRAFLGSHVIMCW